MKRLGIAVLVLFFAPAVFVQTRAEGRLSTSNHSERPRGFVETTPVRGISRLPLPAQATISHALGRDDRAYHAASVDGGFRFENARHGLRAQFSAAGVEVALEHERLTLALRAYGYGEALRPVVGAEPQAEANRVVYRRGTLSEWYVNGPLGLEQGFTLQTPPPGRRRGPLTVSITMGGTVAPRLDVGREGLNLTSSFRYSGLFAIDADGRELPTSLELDGRTLLLRVDDDRARYPLTIDPFVQQAQLTASDGAAGDQFGGFSVALSGDTALVGAYADDVGANENQGSAYVFTRAGGVWTQQAKLTASDGAAHDNFGLAVALSGDTALVGAYQDDIGANVNQGSAYVFTRASGVWTQQVKLTASNSESNDFFGGRVALSGDTALVGVWLDDVGANADQGSAYVFTRAGGVWTQQAQLIAADGAAADQFGISVAVNENTALVGAYFDDVGANADQGSAYVFTRAGAIWTQQQKLTAGDGAAQDFFGISVGLSGDTAVVGSYFDDVATNADQRAEEPVGAPALRPLRHLTAQGRARSATR